ncbi:Bax inhibitor-1/YccA family protein [Nocardioides caricicola]|uniref:Bax inhibitor-1/YccA family protein n=1 Tax=Nocardioides caricicola TaxID=634770 RepID=A0ABW0MVS6_9ACTN
MQSNNPVFRRSEEFNSAGRQTYAGTGYTDPSTWSTGQPGDPGQAYTPAPPVATGGPMTIDSVVQKTAISLFFVIAAAAVTWYLTPDIADPDADLGPLIALMTIGSLGAFVLSMVNSFKRVISPALVVAFCVAEGIALGGLSKFFDAMVGDHIVMQAVIGTFAAFVGTLAAYKFFDIKVGARFRTFVIAAVFGMIALSLLELVLGIFGESLGIYGMGGIGLVFAIIGLVLGVFMLILDFDFVEQGIANQIPERESWRAAFALTVSLVWIYTNLLRILAIVNSD